MARPKDGPAVKMLKILERELAKAERAATRKAHRRANWSDPEAKRAYLRDYKRKQRQEALPGSRICPGPCGRLVTRATQWVRLRTPFMSEGAAHWHLCRSCAMRHATWRLPAPPMPSDGGES